MRVFTSVALAAAILISVIGVMELGATATKVLILVDCKHTGAHDFGGAVITCQVEGS